MNSSDEKNNVAILTNFMDFNPGYSLSGIVVDQSFMLLRQGYNVHIFVNEQYNPKYETDAGISRIKYLFPETFSVRKKTRFMHLTDYETKAALSNLHKEEARETADLYRDEFDLLHINYVFTHDYIFTGWNLPYSEAIKIVSQFSGKDLLFYHWVHSVPSSFRDWWNIESYGPNHFVVFPNRTEIKRVADSFNTSPTRVLIVPHIKDIRTWYDFGNESMDFIDKYPRILQAEVVQVYPCSTDRLSAKQLDIVIKIFANLKKIGVSVFLCIANQWATGKQRKEDIGKYKELAKGLGLVYGDDYVFTSEYNADKYDPLPGIIKHADSFEDLLAGLRDFNTLKRSALELIIKRFELNIKRAEENKKSLDEVKEILLEDIQPYSRGIDKRMLRELQLLSSVFIFPTREESFGLVGPEASYSGCLVVSNRSLIMMKEVLGDMAPSYDFGSHHNAHETNDDYLRAVAYSILNRIYSNEGVMTKIYCRKRYNMESVFFRYYLPILPRV